MTLARSSAQHPAWTAQPRQSISDVENVLETCSRKVCVFAHTRNTDNARCKNTAPEKLSSGRRVGSETYSSGKVALAVCSRPLPQHVAFDKSCFSSFCICVSCCSPSCEGMSDMLWTIWSGSHKRTSSSKHMRST